MSEVISACENVCRDFSWVTGLGQFSVPALIGSATALLIAFVAYPWQKAKDQAFQLRKEQRVAYRDFIDAWMDVQRQINLSKRLADDDIASAMEEYTKALRMSDACVFKLGLSGTETVMTCVSQMHSSMYSAYKELGEVIIKLYKESSNGSTEKSEISKEYKRVLSQLKDSERQVTEELLFLMRSEEFAAPGRLIVKKPDPVELGDLEEKQQ